MAQHKDGRPQAVKISSDIRSLIMSGEWPPGSRIPTTTNLMTRYDTSNVTVQRSLKILKEEGLLVGRSGSGVYVRDTPPQVVTPARYADPRPLEEHSRWEITPGRRTTTRILSVSAVRPPLRVTRDMGEERAVERVRLGLLDGEPAEVTRSWYPESWARGTALAARKRIPGGSPAVLRELGRSPASQADEVAARAATAEEYALLELPGDVPVLEVYRVVRDGSGECAEVTEMVKPGHLYKLGYTLP